MGEIRIDLSPAFEAFHAPDEREVSKGIVVNPGRMGGKPCIAGTRLLAKHVAGYPPDSAIENWPFLSWNDIANARGWDRKGRPE